jgi:hypothetical protein
MFYYSRSINTEQAVRLFTITIGPRGAPRVSHEVMAPDSFTAHAQHADQALEGERVEVTPVPSEAERKDVTGDLLAALRELMSFCESTCVVRDRDGREIVYPAFAQARAAVAEAQGGAA